MSKEDFLPSPSSLNVNWVMFDDYGWTRLWEMGSLWLAPGWTIVGKLEVSFLTLIPAPIQVKSVIKNLKIKRSITTRVAFVSLTYHPFPWTGGIHPFQPTLTPWVVIWNGPQPAFFFLPFFFLPFFFLPLPRPLPPRPPCLLLSDQNSYGDDTKVVVRPSPETSEELTGTSW